MNNIVTKTLQTEDQLWTKFFIICIGWSVIVSISLFWNIFQGKEQTQSLVHKEARTHFNKDQAFRYWATTHGGVYVQTNQRTPPNPNLAHIPERDIETPSGKRLTLMNPAYMLRQLMDEYTELYGVKGRIVSLKPFRQENTPDEWERKALLAFEQGVEEVLEINSIEGQSHLRLMRPMITTKGCLKCHAVQGYKVGDVRGGVGVSVPMAPYLANERAHILTLSLSHAVIWLLGIIGIVLDHLRRKRATVERMNAYLALRKSEEEYSDLYDRAPDLYVSVDVKTALVVRCNQTTADVLGYKKEEIIGQLVFNLYHPDCMANVKKAFKSFVETGKVHDAELQLMKKDGSKLDVSLNVTSVRDDEGNILYSRSTWRDITERKRAEEEISSIRHYLQNVIDSMPSMLVGVDDKGYVTHWNQQAAHISGISFNKAKGQLLGKVIPMLSREIERVKIAIRDQQAQKIEHLHHHEAGEVIISDVIIYPLVMNSVVGAVIRIDDVTERVHMEQLMTQTEKMMSLGGLAAGMAHELNNPLAGMLQGLQNIQRRLSPELTKNRAVAAELDFDLEKMQEYVQRREIEHLMEGMAEAGQRAGQIVTNMLSFSRKSKVNVKASLEDLAVLLDGTIKLASVDYDLKKKFDFRAIEIQREYEPNLPLVPCVATEIQQVLLNLLRNAAQALSEQESRSAPPRITIRLRSEENKVCIEVEDNGPGMDEATRLRIFEPFFTTHPPGEGTGLGLSVSYFILHDKHNGSIDVVSTQGEGTKFIIELPLKADG